MKQWKLESKIKPKKAEEVVDILLKNRELTTPRKREEFFKPQHPEEITVRELGISKTELQKAIKRIKKAIKNKEKIIVYGDYDVDGIAACAILWETLHFLGARALPYIPDRFSEGYGLNKERIRKLKEEDPELALIITVDHGIVAHEKVDLAKSLGVDVIVTDHHEPGNPPAGGPKAHAVVHTTKVSGSAVAWILSREIRNTQDARGNFPDDHLGLVALGTIADVLPLLEFNRSFAVHGLRVLRKTDRVGIKALCREAGVEQKEIGTFHIGFILAPRLNAMGRVEHALDSLRLLCTRSRGKASDLALKLGKTNRLRQEKTETSVNHVNESFATLWSNGNLPKLLFVHHESYEEGIIGIVAGRLVEQYYRPAIVVSRGEEMSRASARSIRGVNIIDTIRQAGEGVLPAGRQVFVSVGGHPMAAGFTVKTENLELLAQKLAEITDGGITEEVLLRTVRIDCELSFKLISLELYQKIFQFSPFGYGNLQPSFVSKRVTVEDARLVGRDKSHLKLKLNQNGVALEAIGFRMGDRYNMLSRERLIDIVYSVEEDTWNGNHKVQLKIKDVHI